MVEQGLEDLVLPEILRPPTPPRNNGREERTLSYKRPAKNNSLPVLPPSSNSTPNSSFESPGLSISKKKVGFSDSAQYSDPPTASWDGNGITRVVTPLPPSAKRRPSKSILKISHNGDDKTTNLKVLPPHQHPSFAKMLESILQQLATGDRNSKLDSYVILEGTLKATNDLPSTRALKDNIGPLCKYMGRDLTQTFNEKLDSQLTILMLKVLVALLFKSAVAESIPTDFQVLFVDNAVKVLSEKGGVSKEAAKVLLHVLALQNFSPNVMTLERVGKLVAAMHNVDEHVQGRSILHGRIQIYLSFIRNYKKQMLAHTSWVEDLVVDMTSTLKDVRQEAVRFGLEAAYLLGAHKEPWLAISALFNQGDDFKDGTTYANFYAAKLKSMLSDVEAAPVVPQIWSVLILFQRFSSKYLAGWKYQKPFLDVIQLCINHSDKQTATEAQYAWNRYIYAAGLNESTPINVRRLAAQPIISQLQLQGRKKVTLHNRALGNAYNLLYYALRPIGSSARLDLYWDEYVVPLIESLTPDDANYKFAYRDATAAAILLTCLFDTTTTRKWSETRAMDKQSNTQVTVNELPGLDSKWLRKNSSRVFPVISRLLKKMYWDLSDPSSAISGLWQAYIRSIASATHNEATVSMDTMNTVANFFGFLSQSWNAGSASFPSMSSRPATAPARNCDFLASFESLLLSAINELEKDERSMRPFTEKRLSITQDTFVAIVTPSHQPKKIRGDIKSPLHHLVTMFTRVSPGLKYDQRFSQVVYRILLPFVEKRGTSRSKLELIKDLMNLLPFENTSPVGLLWQALAAFAAAAVDTRDDKEIRGTSEEPLGSDYRSMVKLLEVGIRLSPNEPLANWKILFDSLANSASLDAGDSGRAVAVIEPIARALLHKSTGPETSANGLFYLQVVLAKVAYPKDRQALDAARRKLWGAASAGHKLPTFDPYEHLYEYLRKSLEESYATFSKHYIHIYEAILSATSGLLGRCPVQLLLGTLSKVQYGMSCWVIDSECKLGGGTMVGKTIISLWSMILHLLPRLLDSQAHTKVLSELEVLISSGLETKHKALVNASIASWNTTFGSCETSLEYPDRVKAALLRLRPEVDEAIKLPFFPESLTSEISIGGGQRLRFTDSQDDYGEFLGASTLDGLARENPLLSTSGSRRFSNSKPQAIYESGRPALLSRSRENTPDPALKRKKVITPKLRHQDSQIQFEAIDSSPIVDRVIDSQLLTEKQREIRERQRDAASIFPDIRSNPRARTKSVDPELPIHRSSSKLRALSSPRAGRHTTPTLVAQSDDDAYVGSSPTPTRSLRGAEEAVPSSPSPPPPAAPQPQHGLPTDEIPSSPPKDSPEPMHQVTEFDDFPPDIDESDASSGSESESDPGFDAVASPKVVIPQLDAMSRESTPEPSLPVEPRDHSSQAVPNASDLNRTISSYVPSSDVDDIMSSPSAQLKSTAAEAELYNNDHVVGGSESPQTHTDGVAKVDLQMSAEENSGTPSKKPTIPSVEELTPKTPQFLDAKTSPASSNNIFEDAVEETLLSPRLNVEKIHNHQKSSSPLTDLDESSMLRVMDRYDKGSQEPAGASPREVMGDSARKRTRTSLLQSDNDKFVTPPLKKRALGKKASSRKSFIEGREGSDLLGQSSSVPSIVPETPGPHLVLGVNNMYNDDGELCTLEDTIVCDTSALDAANQQRDSASKRRMGNRRKSATSSAKKRRFQDITPDEDEVSDSQEAAAQAASQQSVEVIQIDDSQPEENLLEESQPEQSQLERSHHKERKQSADDDSQRSFDSFKASGFVPVVRVSPRNHSPIKHPPQKKRRGRKPKASSDVGHQADVPESANQSFQSVDFDASINNDTEPDITTNFSQITNEASPDDAIMQEVESSVQKSLEIPQTVEEPAREESDIEIDMQENTNEENGPIIDVNGAVHSSDGSVEADVGGAHAENEDSEANIEDTTMYGSTVFDELTSTDSKVEAAPEENTEGGAEAEQNAVEPAPDASVEAESSGAMSGIHFDGVRNKVQSLLADLRSAAFGRREVNELEDMFFEAKKELYKAKDRGDEAGR